MNKLLIIILPMVLLFSCKGTVQRPAQQSEEQQVTQLTAQPTAELSFNFTRQSGSASNQYAVWIEDSQGQYVKTLYASRWTANGGYSRRPTSIPLWVQKSNLAGKSREQVDALSGATPRTEIVSHTWDGTDSQGEVVPDADYVLILEGTLRWENQVYYRAPISIGHGVSEPEINIEYVSGDRNTTAERSMITNVTIKTLR
ncbi:MAG: DUF2271 domain-containing protein [Treponema sp.]|nr:DUF2271 domain-containing protein [Treponema sp.]